MKKEDPWANRSSKMKCRSCMWFVGKATARDASFEEYGEELEPVIGRCRKHAPVVLVGYPVVYPHDWCGDFKMDENRAVLPVLRKLGLPTKRRVFKGVPDEKEKVQP